MKCNSNNSYNTNNITENLVNSLKLLSIGLYEKIVKEYEKEKQEQEKQEQEKQEKEEQEGIYSIIEWNNNDTKMKLNLNDMLFTWGYILSGNIISRSGEIIPIEFLAVNIKQHEDPRFLLFDIAVIKLNSDLYEYNDNNESIGNALFDTKYNQFNTFFKFDKQSEFNYPYIKYLNVNLKEDGFEGWMYTDVNYKKEEGTKLNTEVNKLNTEVELILLTSRNKNQSSIKNNSDDYIIIKNITPLSNENDKDKLKQFLNSNNKLYSYWENIFLDETFFNKNN